MENDKQKNRKNAILVSLLLALIFAYPTFTSAKNVFVDGYIQWTSLILTMFFGVWVLLPFATILYGFEVGLILGNCSRPVWNRRGDLVLLAQ